MILRPMVTRLALGGVPCGAARVRRRSAEARGLLDQCAAACGAPSGDWPQDADGRPLVQAGWHWSLAHRGHYAAAVVANRPVGIDVEVSRPRPDEAFDETGSAAEWAVLGGRAPGAFFRLWTAKEAVLKLRGVGMAGWDRCRVKSALSPSRLVVMFDDIEYDVDQLFVRDAVAALAFEAGAGATVEWVTLEAAQA
jgi:phosphopantetheinyl transferase (holo-ACP synthase)